MRSSKQGPNTAHLKTLHQRLSLALNLGFRSYDDKRRKWHSTDIEVQRHVIRSMDAFLDCVSAETVNHQIVKESLPDIVAALVGILEYRNGSVLSIAAHLTVKMLSVLPSVIEQSYVLDLLRPLSLLLSLQLQVSTPCAASLNLIISNLSTRREKEVWEVLKESRTTDHLVRNIREFLCDAKPIEYFPEMASLLSTILWRWSPSRYSVWNDTKLMTVLGDISLKTTDFSVEVAVLKLCSAIALCFNGAKMLLDNGEAFVEMMVRCMDASRSHSVRVEAFKLAQCLVVNECGCSRVMSFGCEPIIKAIIGGMSERSLHSGKVANEQLSLLVKACRLALVTRWAGEHHIYFWKLGIERALLHLLLGNSHENLLSQDSLSLEEQISMVKEGLKANMLLALRPYIWDILGWLATHCGEGFNPIIHGSEIYIGILISCACLAFVESIRRGRQICKDDGETFRSEPASRAVLMMIYSPCKLISSKARFILSEMLKSNGKEHLKYLLYSINATSRDNIGYLDTLQTVVNLIGITCFISLPQFQRYLMKGEGMNTLVLFIKWCINNHVHIERPSIAPHLHDEINQRKCCWICAENWEGGNILLIFSLWGLAELMHHSSSAGNNTKPFPSELIIKLQEILCNSSTPGPRWYSAYVLSFFGFYGFPTRIGKRIGKAFHEEEYADVQLNFPSGETLSVHGVVLMVRCPSLLPPEDVPLEVKTCIDSPLRDKDKSCRELKKEVRLSSHVDYQALVKLLEFVYLGYLQAEEELVIKLRPIAKRCNLQQLSEMLRRKRPKWGTPVPKCDLTLALGPVGHQFSDVILEAKATESMSTTCSFCPLLVPHMHVHKVILCSSCDYMQALFQSGMQESHSQTIKVPVCFEALVKLVEWFYRDHLPDPPPGCLWDNMTTKEKLHELEAYVELWWLSEFWFLEDVRDSCSRVVMSCLDSARDLSVKIIQLAATLSLWSLAETAANHIALVYPQLRDSGDLEELDDALLDMVRSASVRLSQGHGKS